MRRLAYGLALGLGLAAAAPWLAARLARGRYRRITAARLGLGRSWLPAPGRTGGIWVHALSVGEVRSTMPLLDALAARFPHLPLTLSAATAQGLAVAQQALAAREELGLFVRPLELPWAVDKVLDRLQPRLFCLVEGDIWPGWHWALQDRGVPCILVNGRVSPRTFRAYRRFAPLARGLLGSLDRILVQTEVDRRRLLAVGVDPGRVAVGGNLKFDSAPRPLSPEQREELAQELGLEGRTVLVAGSTHPGEEEPCLEALAALRREHPGLALVIAPREVSRGGAVARLAAARGLSVARVSQGEDAGRAEVLVLDVLGRLAAVYALARAAFVGGSLVPVGGHNLLEPAAQGVPVVFGPHTHNFLEMARQLEEAGGGLRVAEGSELAAAWDRLLDRPEEARAMGRAGQEFCAAHRGAVARAVEEIAALMGES